MPLIGNALFVINADLQYAFIRPPDSLNVALHFACRELLKCLI